MCINAEQFAQFQQETISRYPEEGSTDNHNKTHSTAVLCNVDTIVTAETIRESPTLFTEAQIQNAKLAALIHDLARLPEFRGINIEDVIRENLAAIQPEEAEIEDIIPIC